LSWGAKNLVDFGARFRKGKAEPDRMARGGKKNEHRGPRPRRSKKEGGTFEPGGEREK